MGWMSPIQMQSFDAIHAGMERWVFSSAMVMVRAFALYVLALVGCLICVWCLWHFMDVRALLTSHEASLGFNPLFNPCLFLLWAAIAWVLCSDVVVFQGSCYCVYKCIVSCVTLCVLIIVWFVAWAVCVLLCDLCDAALPSYGGH